MDLTLQLVERHGWAVAQVHGDVDMTTGGDAGEHPLHDDLTQQVFRRERLPRIELDLTAALGVAATRPSDADLAGAEHNLAGRCAVPVPDPVVELGVLRADDPGQLGIEHLAHHDQTGRRRERQQPVTHRLGDIGHRHRRFQRQTSQLGRSLRRGDLHNRYLLHR